MEPEPSESFNVLVERFLGKRLPDRLADEISLARLSPDAREIIWRMLALMKRSSFPITDFNAYMVRLMATITPAMLPSAWGGRIPPLTVAGRHKKLDTYVHQQHWKPNSGRPVFLDLGCGFPPVTTAETANSLPDWSVFGVDRTFASYVLYHTDEAYACFDRDGKFLYFQPLKRPLHENARTARDRFETLFAALSKELKVSGDNASRSIEKNGHRLVYNHIRDYEAQNLKFIESEIQGLQVPSARLIRCMNVLLYFDVAARQKLRQSMEALLDDGGLLISGFNHPFGIYARYVVRRKSVAATRPCEFAFSLDNLRPLGMGPWVTIKGDDEDAILLADLTSAIRADRRFWPQFSQYVDELRARLGICIRDDDGYIRFTREAATASPQVILQKSSALWHQLAKEGYTDGAVAALGRAGYQAWKNPVGDIAILPPAEALSAG